MPQCKSLAIFSKLTLTLEVTDNILEIIVNQSAVQKAGLCTCVKYGTFCGLKKSFTVYLKKSLTVYFKKSFGVYNVKIFFAEIFCCFRQTCELHLVISKQLEILTLLCPLQQKLFSKKKTFCCFKPKKLECKDWLHFRSSARRWHRPKKV